jgi:hypothetical protein
MKMLDFVWFEDQALHMIDISLTPEQKTALEARHTKARDGSVIPHLNLELNLDVN